MAVPVGNQGNELAMNGVLLPGTTMQLLAAGYCYRLRDVNPSHLKRGRWGLDTGKGSPS